MKPIGKSTGKLTIASSFLLALCMVAAPTDAQEKPNNAANAPSTAQVGSSNGAVATTQQKPSQPPSSGNATPKPPRELLLLKPGGHYPIHVARARHTFLDFPGEIRDHTRAVDHPFFKVRKVRPTRLRVIPAPNAPMDARLDVAVDFVVDNVTFNLQLGAEDQADHQVNVHVVSLAAIQALAARIAQPQIQTANDKTDEAEDRADQAEERADQAEENARNEKLRLQSRALIKQLDGTPYCQEPLHPIFETLSSPSTDRVSWRLFESCWDETRTHLLVPFEVDNGDANPFRAARTVTVTDEHDTHYSARIVHVDPAALPAGTSPRPTTETSTGEANGPDASSNQDNNPTEAPAEPVEIAAQVGVRQTARGVIAIRLDSATSIDDLRIRLSEPNPEPDRARWLEASVSSWNLQRPQVAPYTGDDWSREVARRKARQARATQVILGPSGSLGICWLSDGQDTTNLESTDCKTVGLRLTKGMLEVIAFEVEAVGGWTGTAQFGEQTRSARFGRVTLAGVLRFGQFTIPYARLAIGGQGTSYDGLDSGFEIALSYAVGGGLQRRIGKQLIAGADLSIGSSTDNAFRILQAGVQLAYSWNP